MSQTAPTTPPRNPAARISGFTLAWAAWIGFFLIVEAWALIRPARGDTFSEHWWSLFRVRSKVPLPVRIVLLVLQVGFGVWLVGHLSAGWWSF